MPVGSRAVAEGRPATLGCRIAKLEPASGAVLFTNSQQGYELTTAGQRLMKHGLQAEESIRVATGVMSGSAKSQSSQIRIGAPDGCANYPLPQACAQISDSHPDPDVQVLALLRTFYFLLGTVRDSHGDHCMYTDGQGSCLFNN